VLARDRKDFLKRFKSPDPMAKFDDIQWQKGKTAAPILKECIAWMECEVVSRLDPGNHTVFIGKVVDAMAVSDGAVMSTADYDGAYIGKS
jgi:flavin reductase (DIM6/NTAB) family NADH-FMN oxidoreductase RutF